MQTTVSVRSTTGARERLRAPNARHVAVIVAEDLSGRYKAVIETLAQYLPLIGVEIRTLLVSADPPVATTFPVVFVQPDDWVLRPADQPETKEEGVAPNDEESSAAAQPDFVKFARDVHKLCLEKVGATTIDFSAKSYVALKQGRQAWLPMWPRKQGAYVYLPGGPGGAEDAPRRFLCKGEGDPGAARRRAVLELQVQCRGESDRLQSHARDAGALHGYRDPRGSVRARLMGYMPLGAGL
jgi:hypothetical protein